MGLFHSCLSGKDVWRLGLNFASLISVFALWAIVKELNCSIYWNDTFKHQIRRTIFSVTKLIEITVKHDVRRVRYQFFRLLSKPSQERTRRQRSYETNCYFSMKHNYVNWTQHSGYKYWRSVVRLAINRIALQCSCLSLIALMIGHWTHLSLPLLLLFSIRACNKVNCTRPQVVTYVLNCWSLACYLAS